MSHGIVYKTSTVFVGDGVDSLPVIKTPLYPLPSPSPDIRISADRGVTVESGLVTSWEATEGTAPVTMTVPGYGNQPPTAGTVDGRTAVSFNGVDMMLSADFATDRPQPYTIALVAKLRGWASSKSLHTIVGGTPPGESRVSVAGEISANSTGFLAYAGTLQSIGGPNYGSIDPNGWHVITVAFDGNSSRSLVDNVYSLTRTPGSSPRGGLTLGGASSGLWSPVDVAEVATWPRALSAEELSAVSAAMIAAHGL